MDIVDDLVVVDDDEAVVVDDVVDVVVVDDAAGCCFFGEGSRSFDCEVPVKCSSFRFPLDSLC